MNGLIHAGYVLDGIIDATAEAARVERDALRTLWSSRCIAEAEASFDLSPRKLPADPIILAASNIVSRGLPTLVSRPLERHFTRGFPRIYPQSNPDNALSITPAFAALLIAALRAAGAAAEKPPGGGKSRTGALLASVDGREALQLVLSPLGAARVLKALISAVIDGALDLAAPSWSIDIIERDVPCAAIALAEFRRLLGLLFVLEGKQRSVPTVAMAVLPSDVFAASPLHEEAGVSRVRDVASFGACDLFIDVAVLHHGEGVLPAVEAPGAKHRIALRSGRKAGEPRRFLTIECGPLKGLVPDGGGAFDAHVAAAVHELLDDCFRMSAPSDAQLRMIDHALQQRAFIASMPAMSGKTLAVSFAALVHPGYSFMVVPVASLAEDLREQFTDAFIDGVICLHEGLGLDVRQSERTRFGDSQALVLLVTAEMFRSEEMVETLAKLRGSGGVFSQCVVDEAHMLSEWSHDLRLAMQRAPAFAAEQLQAGKRKTVPLRLLTASASRDVLTDLRAQLLDIGGPSFLNESQIIAAVPALRANQQFTCESIGSGSLQSFATARQRALPGVLERQREKLASPRMAAAPENALRGETLPATVLYCPHASGALGVSNRHAPVESESAVDESLQLTGREIGIFIGKDDGGSRVGRQAIVDAVESRRRFRRGELDLLIATRAYGIGIHKPDIRATLHLLPPPHVERLVQECGRGGHDGHFVLHTVLHSGAATPGDSSDLQFMLGAIDAAAADAEREKQIVYDLLREITYPEDSNTGRVAHLIADEFGIEARVNYWQRGLEERMYVQQGGNVVGNVDLVTQELLPDKNYPDRNIAERILDFARAVSLEAAGSGPSLSSWVAATFPSDVDDGLVRQLQDFEPGAEFTLRIGYENDREPLLTSVHQTLWRQAEIEIQRKLFSEIRADGWPEFSRQLALRTGRPDVFASLDPALEAKLVTLFNKIRGRGDTERFIFRLGALGVLRTYMSHPAAQKFSLHLVVRGDGEIEAALERYFAQRMTGHQAERATAALHGYPGDTVLERALYCMIDHACETAHARAHAQARLMDRICRDAIERGDEGFRESITRAVSARYALRWMLPAALAHETNRLRLLADYMQLIEEDRGGSVRENATQLEASCELLSASFPAEPALAVLKSFASLVNTTDAGQKAARMAFAAAFADAASASGLDTARCLLAIREYEIRFRRYFSESDVDLLLSHLNDQARHVAAAPLPAAVSLEDASAAEKREAERREAEKREAEKREGEKREAERREAEKRESERREGERREGERREAAHASTAEALAKSQEPKPAEALAKSQEPKPAEALAKSQEPKSAESQTSPHAARPEPVPPPVPPFDAVREHLTWLKTFNNNFLKHYES